MTNDQMHVVAGERSDKVEIRWKQHHHHKYITQLADVIDGLHGIERVYAHRYSIEVFFAPHIMNQVECVELLRNIVANAKSVDPYWEGLNG